MRDLKLVLLPRCGEAAASQVHRPAQCLDLGVVGGGDHDEVVDVSLELVHHNVLGIVGPLGEGEAGRRHRNRHIPDDLVLIWPHILFLPHGHTPQGPKGSHGVKQDFQRWTYMIHGIHHAAL